jgi:hypothetical protein
MCTTPVARVGHGRSTRMVEAARSHRNSIPVCVYHKWHIIGKFQDSKSVYGACKSTAPSTSGAFLDAWLEPLMEGAKR